MADGERPVVWFESLKEAQDYIAKLKPESGVSLYAYELQR
jgi:hypothetical protein